MWPMPVRLSEASLIHTARMPSATGRTNSTIFSLDKRFSLALLVVSTISDISFRDTRALSRSFHRIHGTSGRPSAAWTNVAPTATLTIIASAAAAILRCLTAGIGAIWDRM